MSATTPKTAGKEAAGEDSLAHKLIQEKGKILYAIPPDFDQAEKHGRAHRILQPKPDATSQEKCPCCKTSYTNKEYSLFVDSKKLIPYGVGFPLLFQFMRFNMLIYTMMFIITGAFTMVMSFIKYEDNPEVGVEWITN